MMGHEVGVAGTVRDAAMFEYSREHMTASVEMSTLGGFDRDYSSVVVPHVDSVKLISPSTGKVVRLFVDYPMTEYDEDGDVTVWHLASADLPGWDFVVFNN
jgi:hypothetical protein